MMGVVNTIPVSDVWMEEEMMTYLLVTMTRLHSLMRGVITTAWDVPTLALQTIIQRQL